MKAEEGGGCAGQGEWEMELGGGGGRHRDILL